MESLVSGMMLDKIGGLICWYTLFSVSA